MQECVIAVSSMTYAIKGQNILVRSNLSCKIVRLSPSQTRRGCAYGLALSCEAHDMAHNILISYGIPLGETVIV